MTPRHKKRPISPQGAQKLRIIGGQWRGRVLSFPSIEGLRPTGNRIRETLFNWLMPILSGSRCLDLYAGSGAMGFEALSRGAKHCQLIELNSEAAKQLCNNANSLRTDAAKIIRGNTLQLLKKTAEKPFDIVFLDPPFAANLWKQTAEQLEDNDWLKEGSHIYMEAPVNLIEPLPASWQLQKQKKAGQVQYSLYCKQ